MTKRKKLAVVGSSGGMKSVFIQGVLNALESGGLRAEAYAGASGSALPAAGAAVQKCNFLGVSYWQRVHDVRREGYDMGETMLIVIDEWVKPPLSSLTFEPDASRLFISASAVITEEAARQTQGPRARRLGRKLLLNIARGERSWIDANLELHLFDTAATDPARRIRPDNIAQVLYASLRMLHTSKVPAEINGRPYVDTSYTCVCPALEVAQQGYDEVIAISTEPGPLYRDMFRQQLIPSRYQGTLIHAIQPEFDLASIGADFTECTDAGLLEAFHYGEERGRHFLATWQRN